MVGARLEGPGVVPAGDQQGALRVNHQAESLEGSSPNQVLVFGTEDNRAGPPFFAGAGNGNAGDANVILPGAAVSIYKLPMANHPHPVMRQQ